MGHGLTVGHKYFFVVDKGYEISKYTGLILEINDHYVVIEDKFGKKRGLRHEHIIDWKEVER